ncbi:FkbM family methyltransferase, partial [archaeon]
MTTATVCFIICIILFVLVAHGREVRRFGPNAFIVDATQGSFVLPDSDSIIADYLKRFGQWEYSSISLVREVLKQYSSISLVREVLKQYGLCDQADVDVDDTDNIILDIGANLGTWSIPLSSLPRAKVYAFEPQRYMMQHLRASLLLNNVSNVFPIYSAVSNVSGHITINDIPVTPSSISGGAANFGALSLLGQLTDHSIRDRVPHSIVPTITLDDFRLDVLQGACPRFLKLDIELYEVYAFIGARQLLRECKPIIFMESHCTALNKSMFLLLHSLGYELYWVVKPLFDTDILNQINVRLVVDDMLQWTEAEFNQLYFGSLNVLALPKTY